MGKKVQSGRVFNIIRYTLKSWMKIYPSSDENNWAAVNYPENIYHFLDNAINAIETEMELYPDDTIRVVTIDEDYFEYLKENNLVDNQEVRTQYATEYPFTDTDLLKKIKENDMLRAYTLLTIPVIYLSEEVNNKSTNYLLTQEQKEKLTQYLEKIHGKGNIYVYGNFIGIDHIIEDESRIIANGNLHFKKGINFELFDYKKQRYAGPINLAFLGIPFLAKVPINKCVFKMSELTEIFNDCKYNPEYVSNLTSEEFSIYNIKAINFEDTSIFDELSQDDKISIVPIEVPTYELNEFLDNIINQFN